VEDDDTEWEKFQARLTKREKVLEGKSKRSHSVHCPLYPEVSIIANNRVILVHPVIAHR
jgi:hypothetical protein